MHDSPQANAEVDRTSQVRQSLEGAMSELWQIVAELDDIENTTSPARVTESKPTVVPTVSSVPPSNSVSPVSRASDTAPSPATASTDESSDRLANLKRRLAQQLSDNQPNASTPETTGGAE